MDRIGAILENGKYEPASVRFGHQTLAFFKPTDPSSRMFWNDCP